MNKKGKYLQELKDLCVDLDGAISGGEEENTDEIIKQMRVILDSIEEGEF